MHWLMEERRGTGKKPPWNLACKFISQSINHSSIKEKEEEKGNTPFDFSNPAELLQRDLNPDTSLILDLYLPVTQMACVASCMSVRVVQVPAGHPAPCSVHSLQGSSSTALHTGLQRAQELDPATAPGQEKEADQGGSFHPSKPDVAAPRCKLHTSTSQ